MMNTRSNLAACLSILGLLGAHSAIAQNAASEDSDQWQFAGALYLWGSDLGGTTSSGTGVDVAFKDLLDNLETGFMGAFEARKGKWSVLTDVIYMDISADETTTVSVPIGPGIDVTTRVKLDLEGLVFQVGGSYNLLEEGRSRLDLVGGARNLDLDSTVFLPLEALGPDLSITISESGNVWDAIVGVKGQVALSERWSIPFYADIGTGDSDSTWQATVGVSFRAANWVDLALVYRHLEWEFESDSLLRDINFSGPAFGAIFRF
jgi:hypothetical protein